MMRKTILLLAIILFSASAFGQEADQSHAIFDVTSHDVRYQTGAPTGASCPEGKIIVDRVTGIGYVRVSGLCQALTSASVSSTRTISTTSPITGGGDLSANRTIACATCGVTGTGLNQFASTTSAQLAGVLSDETGSGAAVFGTSPTLGGSPVISSNSATALAIGPNGSTNPVVTVDGSVASQADGVKIAGNAAGSGVTFQATSSGSNAPINLTTKGTGNVFLSGQDVQATLQANRYFIVKGPSNNVAYISANGDHAAVSGAVIKWDSSATNVFGGSDDTGLARNAASVVEINNGTAGQSGVLLLRGRTFANLPASPVVGMQATVTDSNTTTWGATIAGGGANTVLAFYNGTAWTVAAK